uniref:Uncharacterized protein n=1 Tax=Aegilops tauschii subsp. strangulata TaxID=200361 RepID=A0A453QTX2_AEGTS
CARRMLVPSLQPRCSHDMLARLPRVNPTCTPKRIAADHATQLYGDVNRSIHGKLTDLAKTVGLSWLDRVTYTPYLVVLGR